MSLNILLIYYLATDDVTCTFVCVNVVQVIDLPVIQLGLDILQQKLASNLYQSAVLIFRNILYKG